MSLIDPIVSNAFMAIILLMFQHRANVPQTLQCSTRRIRVTSIEELNDSTLVDF